MDHDTRNALIWLGIVFCLAFLAMTLYALSTAEANFGSLLAFTASFAVIGLVLLGLIGALRNPPDD
jgi:hypothetical protein